MRASLAPVSASQKAGVPTATLHTAKPWREVAYGNEGGVGKLKASWQYRVVLDLFS